MKKKMVVFYSLMFLPLVVVLIALQFLPELIPAHYDMNNQVTRWGSKYETLIFPVITVLFGYFMLAMAKLSSKQEENGSNNKNVCIVTGIASLALFNAMTVYFLYADFNSIENLSSIALDLNQLVFGLLGVFLIIIRSAVLFNIRSPLHPCCCSPATSKGFFLFPLQFCRFFALSAKFPVYSGRKQKTPEFPLWGLWCNA